MTCCPYLKKSGKLCGCQLEGGQIMCGRHNKNQTGGSFINLNYPINKILGIATLKLMEMNSAMAGSYVSNKKGGNKGKR